VVGSWERGIRSLCSIKGGNFLTGARELQTVRPSELLISYHVRTRCYNPEDHRLQCRENLKPCIKRKGRTFGSRGSQPNPKAAVSVQTEGQKMPGTSVKKVEGAV